MKKKLLDSFRELDLECPWCNTKLQLKGKILFCEVSSLCGAWDFIRANALLAEIAARGYSQDEEILKLTLKIKQYYNEEKLT